MEFLSKLFHLIFGGLGNDDQWRDMVSYIGVNKLYFVLSPSFSVKRGWS